MDIGPLSLNLQRQASPLPIHRGTLNPAEWSALAPAVAELGGRLIALWASDRGPAEQLICAAYANHEGLLWVELPLAAGASYPALSPVFPAAARMERAVRDLSGLDATGAEDHRPWLNHGTWPEDWHPLGRSAAADQAFPERGVTDYPFVRVVGDGVHEIPVGPVHAGIIEPGHFRFSIVGERVLRLEQRLGYTHKGIEQRFSGMAGAEGHRLAGRVSGDSTVAYAWAYAMAFESARGLREPERARWLRALMLERERVANHLGDLGALGNDAAFAFGLAQFSRLREDWLRTQQRVFGHRLMMDRIVPGGVAVDVDSAGHDEILGQCAEVAREVRSLRRIYDEHQGLQDRFVTTGRVSPQLATQLGLTGLAARASGIPFDLRADYPFTPYADLNTSQASQRNGDVAARVQLRFDEIFESLRLIQEICRRLPAGELAVPLPADGAPGAGIGWVEGWRGEVLVALELEADGRIGRCHCHDPSWQNWPVLEHAVIGNIVPDFPLINKSFNLSYSGQDL